MNLFIVLGIGLGVGVLAGVSIFFAREEPNKLGTFFATTLRSLLVSLLSRFSLGKTSPWWLGLGYGALYGLVTVLVVVLAESGFKKSKDAPYLLIGGVVTGAIIGLLVARLAF